MKTSGVSQLSITTTPDCEEPVSALLERIFAVTPTIYHSAESNISTVTAYVRAAPAALRKRAAEIRTGLAELRELGLEIGPGEVRVARVRREDWAESWKKYFKLITIGSALVIKPSWTKLKRKPGQAVVTLDPGLSFGTGQHATTSFCLRQIVLLAGRGRGRLRSSFSGSGLVRRGSAGASPHRVSPYPVSLLDIGCGSGILAIAAAKLGYAPVDAFDFDPVSVRVAEKNCGTNRVEKKVSVTRKDLTKIPVSSGRKYDVVCANLMAPLLIAERDRILNRLAPTGTLILAGILASEFPAVRARYEGAGLKLLDTRQEREWQSGSFKRTDCH
jgi:ribosomal protein L11 methyltransferase